MTVDLVVRDRKLATSVGDEGGFAPDFRSNVEALVALQRDALEKVVEAIQQVRKSA